MIKIVIEEHIERLKLQGLSRRRQSIEDKTNYSNFSSNDYLGLSEHPKLKKAFIKGFSDFPISASASMVVCGYHKIHKSLESAVAKVYGVDDALVFPSGYTANLALVSLLAYLKEAILIDKEVHASIYDGLNLAKAKFYRFSHNNIEDAKKKVQALNTSWVNIISEGIFSMSGQKADLKRLVKLCENNNAQLLIDESHSFGTIGPHGKGRVAELALTQNEVPLRLLTFGKALGCQGAIIVGAGEWIELLLQVARPYIYTTGLSPALTYGLSEGFSLLLNADGPRKNLEENIAYFRENIKQTPLVWRDSTTAIQQLQLGCPYKALKFANELKTKNILCLPMRQPTVSKKDTGLRVVLRANHSHRDIDNLFKALKDIYEDKS